MTTTQTQLQSKIKTLQEKRKAAAQNTLDLAKGITKNRTDRRTWSKEIKELRAQTQTAAKEARAKAKAEAKAKREEAAEAKAAKAKERAEAKAKKKAVVKAKPMAAPKS